MRDSCGSAPDVVYAGPDDLTRRGDRGEISGPVLGPPYSPRRTSAVLHDTLCCEAHTFPPLRSNVHSLRGKRMSREGAGQQPTLLLDLGSLPDELPAARQEHLAGSSAREGILGYVHEATRYERRNHQDEEAGQIQGEHA